MPTLKPGPKPVGGTKEQIGVRVRPQVRSALDNWLAELNVGRSAPLKRSDLARGILEWAAEHRPDWERRG
jgi:hypothetical protein